MIQRAPLFQSDRPFNSAYWLDIMQQWAQQYNRLVCCILSFPPLQRAALSVSLLMNLYFIKTWRPLLTSHTCRAVSAEKKNPKKPSRVVFNVGCSTSVALIDTLFKWSFDSRRTLAPLNVWTQAEGEINESDPSSGYSRWACLRRCPRSAAWQPAEPRCRWCCGVRTPQAAQERTH